MTCSIKKLHSRFRLSSKASYGYNKLPQYVFRIMKYTNNTDCGPPVIWRFCIQVQKQYNVTSQQNFSSSWAVHWVMYMKLTMATTICYLASYAAVISVASSGEWGSDTNNGCVGGYLLPEPFNILASDKRLFPPVKCWPPPKNLSSGICFLRLVEQRDKVRHQIQISP